MLRFNNEKLQEKKKKNTNNRYGKPIMSVCQQKNLIVLSRQDRHTDTDQSKYLQI